MAVGNLEAIRDWMSDNWYNFEQMNDILACGAEDLYNKSSRYYCDDKDKRFNWIYVFKFYKSNNIPCYQASYNDAYPVLVSKKEDGVSYRIYSTYWYGPYTVKGSFVRNGITWYYSGDDYGVSNQRNNEFAIGRYDTLEDAAKALVELAHTGDLL